MYKDDICTIYINKNRLSTRFFVHILQEIVLLICNYEKLKIGKFFSDKAHNNKFLYRQLIYMF